MNNKSFANRQIPEQIYDKIYLCCNKQCRTIVPGNLFACPNCKGEKFQTAYSKLKQTELFQCAKNLLSWAIAFIVLYWIVQRFDSTAAITLVLLYVILLLINIFIFARNFQANVVYRFQQILNKSSSQLFRSYIGYFERIISSESDLARRYEKLRDLSYIYDTGLLKQQRLKCLQGIAKTRYLDYETDELVPEVYNKSLVEYYFEVARINPDKIGSQTIAYFLKFYSEVLTDFSNGRAICARLFYSGIKYSEFKDSLQGFLIDEQLTDALNESERKIVFQYYFKDTYREYVSQSLKRKEQEHQLAQNRNPKIEKQEPAVNPKETLKPIDLNLLFEDELFYKLIEDNKSQKEKWAKALFNYLNDQEPTADREKAFLYLLEFDWVRELNPSEQELIQASYKREFQAKNIEVQRSNKELENFLVFYDKLVRDNPKGLQLSAEAFYNKFNKPEYIGQRDVICRTILNLSLDEKLDAVKRQKIHDHYNKMALK
ncbi:MAG: hypothetical protein P4L49_05235 [Desulfosporosinus sp.]|nr:hypothetical protein [Desulfosporosinus sp.]